MKIISDTKKFLIKIYYVTLRNKVKYSIQIILGQVYRMVTGPELQTLRQTLTQGTTKRLNKDLGNPAI
jgi:hypothetical protein